MTKQKIMLKECIKRRADRQRPVCGELIADAYKNGEIETMEDALYLLGFAIDAALEISND